MAPANLAGRNTIANGALDRSFYARKTLLVARELLGTRLVVQRSGTRLVGYITETEAYIGEEDQACHARAGRTPRTQVMYGPPGKAYVYFTYGMHWMLNAVTESEGFPAAVLIRAVYPIEGLDVIAARRNGQPRKQWTNGPAKLCQAFAITGEDHDMNLCDPASGLFIEKGAEFPNSSVTIGPRVGLYHTPEPWKSMAWRFYIPDPEPVLRSNSLLDDPHSPQTGKSQPWRKP